MVQSSGSDMIHFETIRVPMDLVLRSPLEKSADYSFDGKDSRVHTGMVKHTFDKAPKNPLEDLMYTLYPIRTKYLNFVFKVFHMTDDEIKESIEELCVFIFKGNE